MLLECSNALVCCILCTDNNKIKNDLILFEYLVKLDNSICQTIKFLISIANAAKKITV